MTDPILEFENEQVQRNKQVNGKIAVPYEMAKKVFTAYRQLQQLQMLPPATLAPDNGGYVVSCAALELGAPQ